MSEQELKLNVPRQSQQAVEKALRTGTVQQTRLRARYFDTEQRDLVKAGVALRIRLEGNQWVQTIKMPGEHALERIELNHPRPEPTLDFAVYENVPIYKKLLKLQSKLDIRYETDIQRLYRKVRTTHGVVEIAYDRGEIIAGGLTLPVSEVEFELLSGQPQAIFEIGMKWQRRFGLILDLRSKAERGDLLAATANKLKQLDKDKSQDSTSKCSRVIANFWKPRTALQTAITPDMTSAKALSTVMQECLEQIIRNSAVLAEVDTAGICQMSNAEHTHQLRIGMRRLRSAWSLFSPLTPLPPKVWRDELKQYFSQLGSNRDSDVIRNTIIPALEAAGQPTVEIPESKIDDNASEIACSKPFQSLQLQLLAWSVNGHPLQALASSSESPATDNKPDLKPRLRKRLRKWTSQILKDGLKFQTLPVESRHELRKQVKRLRYCLQFASSVFDGKKYDKFNRQLAKVQETLGEMNDLYLALDKFEAIKSTQPGAWFAVGWIASRLETLAPQVELEFQELQRLNPL